jgi:hypothetical protein
MGILNNFFTKTQNTEKSNPIPDTDKLYGQIFHHLTKGIDSFKFQNQISQTLLNKRQRVQNSNDYIDSLINNVTFYSEMKKEMLKILEGMFTTKAIPDFENMQNSLLRIQGNVKLQVPEAARKNKDIYSSKFKSNNQKIEALQFDYAYFTYVHNLLLDLLDFLTNNSSMTQQLFKSDSKYNVDTINSYLHTYANMILESLSF